MKELKPCPFCGGSNIHVESVDNLRSYICCYDCLSSFWQQEACCEEDNIDAWNRRASNAEPVRHGKNVGTDYDEVDQFVCSECGIELQGWYRVEHDEDDGEETHHEYRFRCCPQCGARVDAE